MKFRKCFKLCHSLYFYFTSCDHKTTRSHKIKFYNKIIFQLNTKCVPHEAHKVSEWETWKRPKQNKSITKEVEIMYDCSFLNLNDNILTGECLRSRSRRKWTLLGAFRLTCCKHIDAGDTFDQVFWGTSRPGWFR